MLALILVAIVSPPATAQDGGWYLGATFGRTYNGADDLELRVAGSDTGTFAIDFDESFSFGAVGGYSWSTGWRLEGEYLYRTNELETLALPDRLLDQGDYSSVAMAGNVYFDFFPAFRLRPYVGFGAAWIQEVDADFEENGVERSFETEGSGIQFMAGLRWMALENLLLDFQLRSLDAGRPELNAELGSGAAVTEYSPVNLQLGIAFRF